MDLTININPLSGFANVTKFNLVPSGSSANISGSQYFWNFGDFNYGTTKETQHVYHSPGIFSINLQVITPDHQIFNTTQTVSTQYILQESISFERVPPPTLAGCYPSHPFKVRITSITPGEHWVDLYALYSRSTPEPLKASKWEFLAPHWRFLDLSGNKIDRIQTKDLPIYGPEGIIGYTGTAEFYFIDDWYNTDQYSNNVPYSTILATLETSATRSFDLNRPTQNQIPSYSNSTAQATLPYVFGQKTPDLLKISENAIWNFTNPKWTNVLYPLVISTTYQDSTLDGFVPYLSGSNLSHYSKSDSLTWTALSAANIIASSISLNFSTNNIYNGYIKGSLISSYSAMQLSVSASASVTTSATSANWLPVGGWVSNPLLGTISKIQLLPTWLSATNLNPNTAQVSNYYTDNSSILAVEPYPSNNIWVGDAKKTIIQKRNSAGTILTSIDLTTIINNSSICLESIHLDGNTNLWGSLQPSLSVVFMSNSGSLISSNAPNTTAAICGASPDRYNNFWSIGRQNNQGIINQYNSNGLYVTSLSLPPSAYPKGIVIDANNNTWITVTSGTSSYLQRAVSATFMQSVNVPYSGIKFITIDAQQNPWFTCGATLGTYNISNSSLAFYPLSGCSSKLGGMQFLPPNLWVLDYDTNITHIINLSGAEIGKFRVNPPGFSFYTGDDGFTKTTYNSATPALCAVGDWTGWHWLNRYGNTLTGYTTSTSTISLTGLSTQFNILCANPYTIFKKNESYHMANKIKELALLPSLQQSPKFFDDYLGSIFGKTPLRYDDLGVKAYEKIANWLNNTQNIDTCNIDELYSLAQMVGLETDDYRLAYPSAIQRWMDLGSMSYNKLWGTQCQCQSVYKVNDSASNHICPLCGNYKPNNRGNLVATSATLSAGQSIILNTKSLNDFKIIPLGKYNNQNTYTLSAWVSTLALGENWENYYEFYQFVPKSNNSMSLGVVDWNNAQTNLLSTNSSFSAWVGSEQILDTIFSFELLNGLKLNNQTAIITVEDVAAYVNYLNEMYFQPNGLYYYISP